MARETGTGGQESEGGEAAPVSGALATRLHGDLDGWMAVGAVLALGLALVLGFAGALAARVEVVVLAGAVAGAAVVLLVAGGWVDGPSLVVLSLPLPALYSGGEVRLAAAAPVTAAAVFGWFLSWGASGRRLDTGALPRRTAALLVAAFAVASVFAERHLTSARELLNFAVLLAFLVAVTDALVREPQRVARLVALLVAVATVCGVLAVFEAVGVLPGRFPRWGTPFQRAALGFGQPNGLGLFLAVLLPFAVHGLESARSWWGRVLGGAAVAAVGLGLMATFSRGSWLAVLAGAAVLLFAGERGYAFRVWAGALALTAAVDVVSGGVIRDTIVRTAGDWVLEQRAALMLAGVLMFLDHPLLGVGPGGYAGLVERYAGQVPQLWDIQATPHNAYVQMAAETGAIGLAAFVAFLGAVLLVLVRSLRSVRRGRPAAAHHDLSLRRAVLWAFATACFAGFFVWPFSHGAGQAVMLVVGVGVALAAECERAPGARAASGAGREA